MTQKQIDAKETKRQKARTMRYIKPIVRNINYETITQELWDIQEECTNVAWYFDTDDDTLINALDGDEDEAFELKMMFSDLCAECGQMLEDLQNEYVPGCFDDFFVSAGCGEYGGGLLGWDTYEQDYFGIGLTDNYVERETQKRLSRLTKKELIEAARACLKVLYAYIGLKNRYENLKAAPDILRDGNTGYLQMVKQIEELYGKAEAEGFYEWKGAGAEFSKMLSNLPQEVWIQ